MIKTFFQVVGGILALVLIVLGYREWDRYRQNKHDAKIASAAAHGDSAQTFIAAADTTHQQGVIIRDNWHILTGSPAVQNNPVAKNVAVEGQKVIANADQETKDLRAANTQLKGQVSDLQSAGKDPGPRAVPYLDPLYSFSSKHRAVPVVRVGVDYRLLPFVSAKLEASYEPPPAGSPDQRPEFRYSVGGHITFR